MHYTAAALRASAAQQHGSYNSSSLQCMDTGRACTSRSWCFSVAPMHRIMYHSVCTHLPAPTCTQDEHVVVFPDIRPAARHHLLVISRLHVANTSVLQPGDLALGGFKGWDQRPRLWLLERRGVCPRSLTLRCTLSACCSRAAGGRRHTPMLVPYTGRLHSCLVHGMFMSSSCAPALCHMQWSICMR